jgi:hypothetical protein
MHPLNLLRLNFGVYISAPDPDPLLLDFSDSDPLQMFTNPDCSSEYHVYKPKILSLTNVHSFHLATSSIYFAFMITVLFIGNVVFSNKMFFVIDTRWLGGRPVQFGYGSEDPEKILRIRNSG